MRAAVVGAGVAGIAGSPMAKSQTSKASESQGSRPTGRFLSTDTRIDPPHVFAGSEAEARPGAKTPPTDARAEVAESPPPAGTDGVDLETVEALRNQARQLAVLLAARQEDLDRRDAQWQTDVARFENERRTSRLWFESRRGELDEHDAAVAARAQEIDERFVRLRDAEAAVEKLHSEAAAALATREEAVRRREAELEHRATVAGLDEAAHRNAVAEFADRSARREAEIELRRAEFLEERAVLQTEREAHAARQADCERLAALPSAYQEKLQKALDEREAELDRREQAVAEQESRLRQSLVEWERLSGELAEQRTRVEAQARHDRLETAEARRSAEAELAEKRAELERQSEQLDFRRAAVRREQDDLAATQRDLLEQRLAAEELWTRLSGSVPPAALAEQLARLRSRLTEQYRLSHDELAAQRHELEALRTDLAAEAERLRRQTSELRRWADARHEEIERQAAFLTQRDAELERQEARFRQEAQAWRQERFRMEQETRRLKAELRRAGLDETRSFARG